VTHCVRAAGTARSRCGPRCGPIPALWARRGPRVRSTNTSAYRSTCVYASAVARSSMLEHESNDPTYITTNTTNKEVYTNNNNNTMHLMKQSRRFCCFYGMGLRNTYLQVSAVVSSCWFRHAPAPLPPSRQAGEQPRRCRRGSRKTPPDTACGHRALCLSLSLSLHTLQQPLRRRRQSPLLPDHEHPYPILNLVPCMSAK